MTCSATNAGMTWKPWIMEVSSPTGSVPKSLAWSEKAISSRSGMSVTGKSLGSHWRRRPSDGQVLSRPSGRQRCRSCCRLGMDNSSMMFWPGWLASPPIQAGCVHPVWPKQTESQRRSVGDLGYATLAAAFFARGGVNSTARLCGLLGQGNPSAVTCRAMLFGSLLGHSGHVQIPSALDRNRLVGPVFRPISCLAQVRKSDRVPSH